MGAGCSWKAPLNANSLLSGRRSARDDRCRELRVAAVGAGCGLLDGTHLRLVSEVDIACEAVPSKLTLTPPAID